MTPAAVIFDCDGVIVDSEPILFAALAENLRAHGLRLTSAQMEHHFLGGTITGVARTARTLGADLPATWVEDFYHTLYARLAENTPLIPGIATVLDALDHAKIPYAVGSNGSLRKMQITLGQHPAVMARLQTRLFSGQALGILKPAPDLYLHAARALDTPPAHCVVVEDSPRGARAARAAGIRCFGFAQAHTGATLAAEGATVFHDMAALPALLGL
ncbi:MAG: HAD family phosphatase [Pseudorhodobacter sp.]|nr:HAD family phosphatase [Pseudorhodobacter sp.]